MIKRIKKEDIKSTLIDIKKQANYDVKCNYSGKKKNIKIHNSEIENIDLIDLHSLEYFYIKEDGIMNLARVVIEE